MSEQVEPVRVSRFNRGVLLVMFGFVVWEATEIYKFRVQTSLWHLQTIENKLAIQANTKSLVDSLRKWNENQQEISNWMKANQVVVDKLHHDNPKLKVPKAPPIPDTLPEPSNIVSEQSLNRPTPRPTQVKEGKHHKRPRPTATPSFLDKVFGKRPK